MAPEKGRHTTSKLAMLPNSPMRVLRSRCATPAVPRRLCRGGCVASAVPRCAGWATPAVRIMTSEINKLSTLSSSRIWGHAVRAIQMKPIEYNLTLITLKDSRFQKIWRWKRIVYYCKMIESFKSSIDYELYLIKNNRISILRHVDYNVLMERKRGKWSQTYSISNNGRKFYWKFVGIIWDRIQKSRLCDHIHSIVRSFTRRLLYLTTLDFFH